MTDADPFVDSLPDRPLLLDEADHVEREVELEGSAGEK